MRLVADIQWRTPFSIADIARAEVQNELASTGGIYLWRLHTTPIPTVFYVGEAQTFLHRISQHIEHQLSGRYWTYGIPDGIPFWDYYRDLTRNYSVEDIYRWQSEFLGGKNVPVPTVETPAVPKGAPDLYYLRCTNPRFLELRTALLARTSFVTGQIKIKESSGTAVDDRKYIEAMLQHGLWKLYAQRVGFDPEKYRDFRIRGGSIRVRSSDSPVGGVSRNLFLPDLTLSVGHNSIEMEDILRIRDFRDRSVIID